MTKIDKKLVYPGLDTLRGIAIILVVIHHYFRFFQIGWIGVDLFFVLSGFLITTILIKSIDQNNFFRNFYMRRIIRIFPIYYLTLIGFYILAPIFFSQKDALSTFSYYEAYQNYFWTFTQNWLFIKEGPPPEPYLIHFWSLAVEEQFYLLWPFLIYKVRSLNSLKNFFTGLFIFSLVFRILIWYNHQDQLENYYYNTFTRIDALTAGAFLAIRHLQNKIFSKLLVILIVFAFISTILASYLVYNNIDKNSPIIATIGYSVFAIFFMITTYLFLRIPSCFPKMNVLNFIGKISYGIYIYHLPVFLILSTLFARSINTSNKLFDNNYTITLASIITTLVISSSSYFFIERPILSFKKYYY